VSRIAQFDETSSGRVIIRLRSRARHILRAPRRSVQAERARGCQIGATKDTHVLYMSRDPLVGPPSKLLAFSKALRKQHIQREKPSNIKIYSVTYAQPQKTIFLPQYKYSIVVRSTSDKPDGTWVRLNASLEVARRPGRPGRSLRLVGRSRLGVVGGTVVRRSRLGCHLGVRRRTDEN
jgi:hypothetical protein